MFKPGGTADIEAKIGRKLTWFDPVAFAKGAAPKAGGGGGIVGAVTSVVGAITGDGGCGNGTGPDGKRGFQKGNRCHGNRNATVTAAQKTHTAANKVTHKHIRAGTLNTPEGRAAIRTAAKAARVLKDARDTHKAAQKVKYAEAAKTRRATAKTPQGQASAALKSANAATKPAPAPKPAAPAKTSVKEHVAAASNEASAIKANAAAAHLKDIHAGAASGRHDEATAAKHIDRLARGHTKDELFAVAKDASIEHGAKTKKALVEHLKATAVPKADKIPLKDFADRAVRAAHASPTGGFGGEKTFISHAHAHLQKTDPAFKDMTPEAFKARLVEANSARHLELGRADLVEAMHPADVKASSTPHMKAEYHFIRHPEASGKTQSRSAEAPKPAKAPPTVEGRVADLRRKFQAGKISESTLHAHAGTIVASEQRHKLAESLTAAGVKGVTEHHSYEAIRRHIVRHVKGDHS